MPAAISTTRMTATTTSTTMQNGGHQRVFATNRVRCCQRSLSAVARQPGDQQPRRPGHRCGGNDDERERHAALDHDDLGPAVGYGEADVDGGDRDQPERVDGRAVEPPEQQRRRRLKRADDNPPEQRPAGCRVEARPAGRSA